MEAKKQQQAWDFNDLLEAGLNPYEVARRRDEDASVAAQRKRIATKLAAGRERITHQLVLEEDTWRRELKQRDVDQVCRRSCYHPPLLM